jgi:hypothetical protein
MKTFLRRIPPKSSARYPFQATTWRIPCYDVISQTLFETVKCHVMADRFAYHIFLAT